MQKHQYIAAGTVVLAGLTAAPALAAATGPKVDFRVEGLTTTLVPTETVITPGSGSITKGGIKPGACPADSAQGTLNVGTRGHWTGPWYASYGEYEITGISGATLNSKQDYWEIFVNNVAATAGACDLKLKAGDQLLFAAVPATGAPETPLKLTVTESTAGIVVKVVAYSAKGKPSPLKGAKVSYGSASLTTGANGTATIPRSFDPKTTVTLSATAKGHIRAEATINGHPPIVIG
jgi:hypothetical protein